MIQVREYARLTFDAGQNPSLSLGVVSRATFDWLLDLQSGWEKGDAPVEGLTSSSLKLGSYVGYIESPSGEGIEILPKTEQKENTDPAELRRLLQRMLCCAGKLSPRESQQAHLARMDLPMHEWVLAQFLLHLEALVKRGLRFDYETVEEESRFIRGRLDLGKQARQSPARAAHFHIRHDVFSPNRIENRLLKTALDYVLKLTKDSGNWRLANMLAHQMAPIKPVSSPLAKLSSWRNSKLMQGYQPIRPWCSLILEKLNPNFQHGPHKGIAMLFKMEQLFENYVTAKLQKQLPVGARLTTQAASKYLTHHTVVGGERKPWFQLKPDMLLTWRGRRTVLDAKWKLLDSGKNTTKHKYGLQQSDFYQLFAYGQKYMGGQGHMVLIYPRHSGFLEPLPAFSFDEQLHLWCVPFDLYECRLVLGPWTDYVAFNDGRVIGVVA